MAKHADEAVYFLLVYSFAEGRLTYQAEFADSEDAVARYNATEKEYRGTRDKYEVVLIAADSIETVMTTHGHYFSTIDDSMFSDFLADA